MLNSFIKVSKELMASAQFDLRGWKHNRPASNEENSILNLSSDEFREIVSVLGLKCNLYSDTLSREIKEQNQYTLRNTEIDRSEAWRHIQGKFNPADLPSRGCNPKALLKSHWGEGPDWLKLLHEEWPASEIKPDMEIVISERRTVLTATLDLCRFAFFQKISFNKIVRIMAYVIRFCKNVKRNPIDRKKGILETDEIKTAEKEIFKEIQREAFSGREKFNLRTVKYSDDLLRVKTRIASRKDLETFRFPILLPHKHQMVEKLIMSKHLQLEHAGIQTLMSCLRESFWIIKSRKTVRGVIKRCTKCRRFSVRSLEAVSIPLPEDRVRDAAVFEVTGIDLCGPLFLKTNNKCWIVLATCAVYRTVHLELVSSLCTECFILALRRFIARRGRLTTIYSYNGKNLAGTANLLQKIDWKKIENFASEKRISW
ncbi:integrase catalytic domain-containing protein [Trichonephila clavipes]|nr:integrase catalytic domain-containing protein [Trichonephila clavipes]